ncbi:PIN domain-containing protein [Gloeobacter violaceus]|uniref:Glr1723 protein n=1 Tax=Gloeobacter violaceus (strain ATCC 29082 / PCC 7421) TaxID=251221 RepID=Q7NJV8_GLOVI|nr:PIN domain-containing protein [Gloeobacter violaceus]BAC89664.1 glr1723 [Gloeobacter violaceus PCC 7421]
MRADYSVVLDANILAESALSDLFLRLSEEPRLLLPKWTDEIWQEVERTMLNVLKWPQDTITSRINAAKQAFPEAMITDYQVYLPMCTNDPKDWHILAAAIRGQVETILTMNVRHFKPADVEIWGVTVAHPDEYLKVLYDLDEAVVVQVLNDMAKCRSKPIGQMLSRLSAPAPGFTKKVGNGLQLTVPPYDPVAYRNS